MRVGEFMYDPNRLGPAIGLAVGTVAVAGMLAWMATASPAEIVSPEPVPASAVCVDAPNPGWCELQELFRSWSGEK